jgi:uncharacterized surface protein with fasciclin (FAS1) repeats
MRKFLALLTILSVLLVSAFSSLAQDSNTIADIVVASTEAEEAEFTVLLAAVQTSELVVEALSDPEAEFTVFAPTDEAFGALLEALGITPEELLEQPEIVEAILLYHVVEGAVMSETVVELDGEEVPTLLGEEAVVTIEITEEGDVQIVDGTDLTEEVDGLEEDTVATVVAVDIEADNGVIHVIDNVLMPNDDMLSAHFEMMEDAMGMEEEAEEDAYAEDTMEEEASNTIADIVIASSEAEEAEFTVLLAAVLAADEGIVTALSDPEAELTVFAPTDEAFVALLEALETDAETLLANTELLNSVLLYHVVEGAVMAETVMTLDGEEVPTLLGEDATLAISITDDGVMLNDSVMVIATDIEADNGVIHVIDAVLVPAE